MKTNTLLFLLTIISPSFCDDESAVHFVVTRSSVARDAEVNQDVTENPSENQFCPYLMCGQNAMKTINPEDFSDCYCSCPHNSQGDPLFECKIKEFGTVPGGNTRYLVKQSSDFKPSWPWMSTIGYFATNGSWVHNCGGSLITHRHVLTAAHCTNNIDLKTWYVLVGANNISLNSGEEWTERRIVKIYKHPKFDNIKGASYYDVAVIVLNSAVNFTDELRPVRIPKIPIVDPDAFAGSSVTIMGWGDGSRKTLESDEIQVYSQRFCEEKYEKAKFGFMRAKIGSMLPLNFTRSVFCAGNPHDVQGACHGDSGGPLVKYILPVSDSNEVPHYLQIGIIQGGARCGDNELPGVFVSLTDEAVLEFVLEKSGLKKDNYWGPWSSFAPCSVSCGDGVQTRKRQCHASRGHDGDHPCEGPALETKSCNWGDCGEEIFSLSYLAVTISHEIFSGCDCKIFLQLTNPITGERCITRRLNKPGNDWAQGTTDIWDNDFLGSCERFSVTSKNPEVEIDFLLSGRDHIQVDAVTASFKSRTSIKEIKFHQFCLGWSGHDLKRTERIAEKPSLLFARMEKNFTGLETSQKNVTAYEAERFCSDKGYRLAEIRSQCQDLKIQEFLKKSDPEGSKTFWIGLSYEKDLGKFTWNGGQTTISYSNWDGNSWPSDLSNRCVRILEESKSRKWKNLSCHYNHNVHAVCQKI